MGAPLPAPDLKNRIRAARELAGIRSDEDLAKRVGERGLGYGTVRAIQRGTRPAYRSELFRIAEVCDVPLDWFYVANLRAALHDALMPTPESAAAALEQELADAAEQVDTPDGSNESDGRAQDA